MRAHLFIYACLLLLLQTATMSASDNKQLLRQLDQALEQRGRLAVEKEYRLDSLKRLSRTLPEGQELLSLYQELFWEYYVYKFDSAAVYNEKFINLTRRMHDEENEHLALIQKSELLALSGRYLEAANNLSQIDTVSLSRPLRFRYHYTTYILNLYLMEYDGNNSYSTEFSDQKEEHLKRAMPYLDDDSPNAEYIKGEYYGNVIGDEEKALEHYLVQLGSSDQRSRFDAMALFAIAIIYEHRGDMEKYEEYLIRSCLADLANNVKENMALQTLAVFLFEQGEDNLERAEKYINISMEDALFYDSRLRIIENSQTLPTIVQAYQTLLKKKSLRLQVAFWGIFLLAAWLLFETFFYIKKSKQLAVKRNQLYASNDSLRLLNDKLGEANAMLLDTNHRRERLAKLYIDLCADYINKLKNYQTLVKRKVKANQAGELLSTATSAKMSEQDAATFLLQFDKAFLDLYPSFVQEINELLRPEERVNLPQKHALTPELRIFALIRLGVKESSEIASLLFLSPQTVYNYRSTMKNKAVNRDTFEEDVRQLCTILR